MRFAHVLRIMLFNSSILLFGTPWDAASTSGNLVRAQSILRGSSDFTTQSVIFDEFVLVSNFAIDPSTSPVVAALPSYSSQHASNFLNPSVSMPLSSPLMFSPIRKKPKFLDLGIGGIAVGSSRFGGDWIGWSDGFGTTFRSTGGGRGPVTMVVVRRPVRGGDLGVGRRVTRPPEARISRPTVRSGTSLGLGRAEPYRSVTRTGRFVPPGATVLPPQFNTLGARQTTPLEQASAAPVGSGT